MTKKKQDEHRKKIKEDLLEQLMSKKMFGAFYIDMVEDYMFFFDTKMELQNDIRETGVRYKTTNGNGFSQSKTNESIDRLLKVNSQMLKILSDFKLQEPSILEQDGESTDEDYL